MTESRFRLSATDLLTGRVLVASLPASVDSYTEALNAPTSITATVAADAAKNLWATVEPRRTAVWLWDGSGLVSGGILWQDDADVLARTIRYGILGHTSYWDRRQVRDSLTYTAVDQLQIAHRLIDYAQGAPDSAVGIRYDSTQDTPIVVDQEFDGSALKPVGETIRQLGATATGFDYRERFEVVDGRPTCRVEFGHPYLAHVNRKAMFVFDDRPGARSNLLSYRWPRDGSGSATHVLLPGAGQGSARLRGVAVNNAEIAAGVPRLDWSSTEHSDVDHQGTLDGLAREYVRVLGGCRVVPSAVVGPAGPALSLYRVGDVCRFRFTSVMHPASGSGPGLEVWLRITGRTVAPPAKNQEAGVQLQLEGLPWELS